MTSDDAVWLAEALVDRAGCDLPRLEPPSPGTAVARWQASGLAELTGPADGPPAAPHCDYADRLEALVRVTRAFAAALGKPLALDMDVYVERARDMGLTRGGAVSCGGAARMLRCGDGWAVVNLARPEDLELFEAWVGAPAGDDPWATLKCAAAKLGVQSMVGQARLLGLPVAVVGAPADEQRAARPDQAQGVPAIRRWVPIGSPRDLSELTVIDLSGLWAGPLCGRLFAELGARVIKVESAARPDGARAGSPAFFARMNAGKQSVILDFASQAGRAELRELIAGADVVIEAARPRALPQLGIDAETIARANRRLTWIGITAYGRTGPWSNAVGFGDDCAAAAGLVVRDESGAPMFVADALADPLAGLMAASAAFAVLAAGGGALIDVALREAALFVAQAPAA